MAGYVHGKPGHDQPRKTLARNPEREVGAFLSVLLVVANNLDPLPAAARRRYATERSGGSRSWKRNDHNGAAVRVAD